MHPHPVSKLDICPARKIALLALVEMERRNSFVNLSLRELLRQKHLPPRERALATQLTMGVAKMRLYLDYILEHVCKRRMERLPIFIRNCLRMGAYELIFMNQPPYAVGNEYVKLAKRFGHEGTAGLVNAVLRALPKRWREIPIPSIDEDPIAYIAITTSHPHWMVKRWIKQWGVDETLKLCDANNQPPPVCIRVNLRWTECELVQRMLEMRCRKVEASPYVPCGLRIETTRDVSLLPGFQEGLFSVQDEAAMLVGYVVDPQPGELIIDACAAPGGKATHMAELTGDQAHIIAIDVHPNRMELVKEMVTRLKLQGVEMVIGDFTELAHQYRRSADRCLLDVPCSGTGTLRRKPDVRWKKSIERIRELSELQAQLLEAAAGVVKRNGIIVYSTCSLEKEENEIIVREFLARHPEFELEDATAYLPSSIPNCCTDDGFIRLFPHRHDTDGAFIARLRRKCA